jgi:hypothetical protein
VISSSRARSEILYVWLLMGGLWKDHAVKLKVG